MDIKCLKTMEKQYQEIASRQKSSFTRNLEKFNKDYVKKFQVKTQTLSLESIERKEIKKEEPRRHSSPDRFG
ncbi:hypothetical protein TetV_033 [Tetraselmis virus 1]|uniref:Uncharacterized protein n=1 Tax=Tetraselmis virus 1 TaxID=2060617 RepID=A0A2P0VMK1_9VIRU|nr:hypothetical protein QJ968_gp033 [Tetraselmis virus 1]AUF82125.1 hypothetical protein TetV_033 [Tetraselmis virus 1]